MHDRSLRGDVNHAIADPVHTVRIFIASWWTLAGARLVDELVPAREVALIEQPDDRSRGFKASRFCLFAIGLLAATLPRFSSIAGAVGLRPGSRAARHILVGSCGGLSLDGSGLTLAWTGSALAVDAVPRSAAGADLAAGDAASALGESFLSASAFACSGLSVTFETIASENFIPTATSTGATTVANTPAMAFTIMLLLSAGFSSLSVLSFLPIAARLARKESVDWLQFPCSLPEFYRQGIVCCNKNNRCGAGNWRQSHCEENLLHRNRRRTKPRISQMRGRRGRIRPSSRFRVIRGSLRCGIAE